VASGKAASNRFRRTKWGRFFTQHVGVPQNSLPQDVVDSKMEIEHIKWTSGRGISQETPSGAKSYRETIPGKCP